MTKVAYAGGFGDIVDSLLKRASLQAANENDKTKKLCIALPLQPLNISSKTKECRIWNVWKRAENLRLNYRLYWTNRIFMILVYYTGNDAVMLIKLVKSVFLISVASFLFLQLIAGSASAQQHQLDCSKVLPTQDQVTDLYRAIALHGDLTDIPFIEKTLNLKLNADTEYQDGHPVETEYTNDFTAPLNVSLRIINGPVVDAPNERQAADWNAYLYLLVPSNVVETCFHNIPESFAKKFDGQFPLPPPVPQSSLKHPRNSSAQFLPENKTNGGHIVVGFEGDVPLPYIEQVAYTADSEQGKNKLLPPIAAPDSKPNKPCDQSHIGSEQFTQMLSAIALRGNLKDIPFLERTLHTHFIYKYERSEKGINRNRATYFAPQFSPSIMLNTYEDDAAGSSGRPGISAKMNFQAGCLGLTSNDIYASLVSAKKDFPKTVIVQQGDTGIAVINDAITQISYVYMPNFQNPADRSHISDIGISQESKSEDTDEADIAKAILDRSTTDAESSLSACVRHVKKDQEGYPIRKFVHSCMEKMGYSVVYETSLPVLCQKKYQKMPDGSIDAQRNQQEFRDCMNGGMPVLPNSSPIKEQYVPVSRGIVLIGPLQ